jgi:hypothetical protein
MRKLGLVFGTLFLGLLGHAQAFYQSWTARSHFAMLSTGTVAAGGGGSITQDAVSSATTVGGISTQLTWSHTTGVLTNGAIVVLVGSDGGGGQQVTSVTYGSLALQRSTRSVEASGFILSEIWYGTGPASGSNTVTVNTSGSKNFSAAAITFSNVNQTIPVVTSSGTASDITTVATSLSATATGSGLTDVCVDAFSGQTGTYTPQGGQTQIIQETNPNINSYLMISTKAGAAGSTSMGWTFSAGPRVETTITCIKQAP